MTPAEIAAAITEYDRGDVDRVVDQRAVHELACHAFAVSPWATEIAALRLDRGSIDPGRLIALALMLGADSSPPLRSCEAHRLLIQFALAQPPVGVRHE